MTVFLTTLLLAGGTPLAGLAMQAERKLSLDCTQLGTLLGSDDVGRVHLLHQCWRNTDVDSYSAAQLRARRQQQRQLALLDPPAQSEVAPSAFSKSNANQVERQRAGKAVAVVPAVRSAHAPATMTAAAPAAVPPAAASTHTNRQAAASPVKSDHSAAGPAIRQAHCPVHGQQLPSSRAEIIKAVAPSKVSAATTAISIHVSSCTPQADLTQGTRPDDADTERARRAAAYAANRQGAQLNPIDPSTTHPTSPGTPPPADAVSHTTRLSSELSTSYSPAAMDSNFAADPMTATPPQAHRYRPPRRSPVAFDPSAAPLAATPRMSSYPQHSPEELIQRQTASSWRLPATAFDAPTAFIMTPQQAIKQQMLYDGIPVTEKKAADKADWFDQAVSTSQGVKFHLVGTPDGLICRKSGTAIVVIRMRWADRSSAPDHLSFDEAQQLQGYMILAPTATHTEFVQGWQTADGAFHYHVKKLYERRYAETKALLAQSKVKIWAASRAFVSVLHELRRSQSLQDDFLSLGSPNAQASWLASRLLKAGAKK